MTRGRHQLRTRTRPGCPHPDQWDDPTVCPAPCGHLHTRCGVCHAALQPCPWETK